MKLDEASYAEKLYQESFSDGDISRELRLSKQEKEYLLNQFPNIKITKMFHDNASEKEWYNVSRK